MRALLVVNPGATTTSARTRDVLARALASEVDLTVAQTIERGHATKLARHAAESGMDLVVSLGGDGTVNEVVNGVLAPSRIGEDAPIVGVVPGGSTNVFARALGMPRDPVDATSVLLEALREQRTRTVGLGLMEGLSQPRFFTFCAGFGLDAAVVHRAERARERGKTASAMLYVKSTVAQYFADTDRKQSHIIANFPADTAAGIPESEIQLSLAIVQNTAPWTYLGNREINPCPEASFDTGLDVMGMRSLRLWRTSSIAVQMLLSRKPHGKAIFHAHDLNSFHLQADRPLSVQLDGDYLGAETALSFRSVPLALRVAV